MEENTQLMKATGRARRRRRQFAHSVNMLIVMAVLLWR